MNRLRCILFRGLPKEVEEEVSRFLETTPTAQIHNVVQSESNDHVTLTIFYELDAREDEPGC